MGLRAFVQRLFGRKPAPAWGWHLDGSAPATQVGRVPSLEPDGKHPFEATRTERWLPDARDTQSSVDILEDEPLVPAEAAAHVVLAMTAVSEDVVISSVLQQVSTGTPLMDADRPMGRVVLGFEDGSEVVLDDGHRMLNEFVRAADRMMRPSGWGKRFAQKVGLGG